MKNVVGLYQQFEDAQQVVRALNDAGFPAENINLIASDSKGEYSRYLEGDMGQKEDVSGGAAKGAGVGAVLGGLGGLLLGLGALAIPGIGPVIAAGPIAATLAGAGVGAVAGGLVGALVDLGVPEEHANAYAEGIKQGGTLVTVQTDNSRAQEATRILNRFHPIDITRRGFTQPTESMYEETESMQMEQQVPVTGQPDTVQEMEVNVIPMEHGDWDQYEQEFRQDFDMHFASSGYDYEYYQPAYHYGYDLSQDEQYRGYDWDRMEPIARQDWEHRGMEGRWEDIKDAVRNAWESITRH